MASFACVHCGAIFTAPPSARPRYCSHVCYSAAKRRRVTLNCATCGKPFEVLPADIRKAEKQGYAVRYCSKRCQGQAQQGSGNPSWSGGDRQLTCAWCQQPFTRPRTWPRDRDRTFCSERCRQGYLRADGANNSNWRGGITPIHDALRKCWRGIDWRKAVYARDDYTCRRCGLRGGRLNAHHLYPFSTFPDLRFVVQNGHTLCVECHRAFKGRERDYLIEIGLDPDNPPW